MSHHTVTLKLVPPELLVDRHEIGTDRIVVHVHVRDDEAAARVAIVKSWSNGQTEGQLTKLKLVKRQIYGRAGLDFLRQRVLHAA